MGLSMGPPWDTGDGSCCPRCPIVLGGLFSKTLAFAGFHRNLLKNMVEWYLLLHSCLFASDADAGDYQ